MAISRPFSYNTGNQMPGSVQYGNVAAGKPVTGFDPQNWWNGPDETSGYIIAREYPQSGRTGAGGSITTGANLGFWRTTEKTDASFIELAEYVASSYNDSQDFNSTFSAKNWLLSNGLWTSYSEPIVYDGMVFYMDASNIISYSGEGIVWGDLSGSGNSGTLTNNPTFDSGNNFGSMNFSGTNDFVSIPFNSESMDFSDAQTICMWLKPGVGSDLLRRNPYNQAYGGSGTITHEPNRSFNYYFGTHGGNATPYVGRGSGFTLLPEELGFIAVSRSQTLDLCRWYKNDGNGNFNTAGGYSATNNGNSPILIANGYTNRFVGDIYMLFVYNKYLTGEQILQNYNATKIRFGL
jgi:hypothetical protein